MAAEHLKKQGHAEEGEGGGAQDADADKYFEPFKVKRAHMCRYTSMRP